MTQPNDRRRNKLQDLDWKVNLEAGFPVIAFDTGTEDGKVRLKYNYTGTLDPDVTFIKFALLQSDCLTAASAGAVVIIIALWTIKVCRLKLPLTWTLSRQPLRVHRNTMKLPMVSQPTLSFASVPTTTTLIPLSRNQYHRHGGSDCQLYPHVDERYT